MRDLVVIAESAATVRSLRSLLREAPAFRVVATLDGSFPARSQIARRQPDLVLVDGACQRTDLLARIRETCEAAPSAKVVVLSSGTEAALLDEAFAAGAHLALESRLHPVTLATLLREVVRGTVQAPHSPRRSAILPPPAPVPVHLVRDQDAAAVTGA